jgi:hypothetical protein
MNVVELWELAKSGIKIHKDFWPARAFELSELYKMGEHLKLPATLVRNGDVLVDAGKFRLPSEYVIFAYDAPDQRFETMALLCTQIEPADEIPGMIMSSPLLRVQGRWTEFFGANMWSFSGERRQYIAENMTGTENQEWLNAVMSMAYALTVGGVAALQSGASKVQEIPPSELEEGPFLTVAEVSFLN